MTKGDIYTIEMIKRILKYGRYDINPRPKYADGTPAHTISVNHAFFTYDLSKGETPLITLREIAVKWGIGEILWIYRDMDSNIYNLETKYGVNWWRSWCCNPHHYDKFGNLIFGENPNKDFYYDAKGNAIPFGEKSDTLVNKDLDINDFILDHKTGMVLTKDASIMNCYGGTINNHDIMIEFHEGMKKDPDSRRHKTNLWQVDDFKKPHGLKPCAYDTTWNVRHEADGDYLDMMLVQRSSDFMSAGCINQVQYLFFLLAIAKKYGYKPGVFTWCL